MGSRPLSELVLRSSTSYASTPIWQRSSTLCLSRRAISTTKPARAAQPQPKRGLFQRETDAPRNNVPRNAPPPPPPLRSPSGEEPFFFRSQKPKVSRDDMTKSIDSLFRGAGLGKNLGPRQGTSADEMGAAYQTFGNLAPRGRLPRKKSLDFDSMDMPMDVGIDGPPPPQNLHIPDEEIKYPRLNPSTGRTVTLDSAKGRDIVRGIGMLGSMMSRNKVKSDFHKQKFHERPGLKRKRLKSERWRKKFKVEFESVCSRVQELTRKGW